MQFGFGLVSKTHSSFDGLHGLLVVDLEKRVVVITVVCWFYSRHCGYVISEYRFCSEVATVALCYVAAEVRKMLKKACFC
jgi:hypothetical protein